MGVCQVSRGGGQAAQAGIFSPPGFGVGEGGAAQAMVSYPPLEPV